MLTTRYKDFFQRLLRPLAGSLARTGIHPNTITLGGLLLGVLACLWFVRSRAVLPFCGLILAIGCLDAVDGAVARASGKVSRVGAYLDAMADRYLEALVILVVAIVKGYWVLSSIVLIGGQLVSYSKARAAMEAPVTNQEWPDLMERTERSVLFLAGLAAGELSAWRPAGQDLFWWTLVVLAVLIHLTVFQRVRRAVRLIAQRAGG